MSRNLPSSGQTVAFESCRRPDDAPVPLHPAPDDASPARNRGTGGEEPSRPAVGTSAGIGPVAAAGAATIEMLGRLAVLDRLCERIEKLSDKVEQLEFTLMELASGPDEAEGDTATAENTSVTDAIAALGDRIDELADNAAVGEAAATSCWPALSRGWRRSNG